MFIFDAHNHVWESRKKETIGDCKCICNGTKPADWIDVKQLGKAFPENVIPFFGVHPWFVENIPDNWFSRLKKYISGNTCGIGEIGLDGSGSRNDMGRQERVFTAQLEAAAELSLPAAIHCVRSWGKMVSILKSFYPQEKASFMIHSFSGSEEIMNELVKLGGYISFSFNLMREKAEKIRRCLKHVPVDRLLLESDSSEAPDSYRNQLVRLYAAASGIKGIDLHEMYRLILRNGSVFTNRITPRQRCC